MWCGSLESESDLNRCHFPPALCSPLLFSILRIVLSMSSVKGQSSAFELAFSLSLLPFFILSCLSVPFSPFPPVKASKVFFVPHQGLAVNQSPIYCLLLSLASVSPSPFYLLFSSFSLSLISVCLDLSLKWDSVIQLLKALLLHFQLMLVCLIIALFVYLFF